MPTLNTNKGTCGSFTASGWGQALSCVPQTLVPPNGSHTPRIGRYGARSASAAGGPRRSMVTWIGRAPTARDQLRLAAETDFSRCCVTRTLEVFEPAATPRQMTWSGSAPDYVGQIEKKTGSYMSPSCWSKIYGTSVSHRFRLCRVRANQHHNVEDMEKLFTPR